MPLAPCTSNANHISPLLHIGCVSYLNAKPLIENFQETLTTKIRFDVPSLLLHRLESNQVDIALCPVIDYFRSKSALQMVPSGGICGQGRTLTVKLFSQKPLDQIDQVHVDTDSHTSVALLQILMKHQYGRRIKIIEFNAREHVAHNQVIAWPKAMLLIGDKVVTDSTPAVRYAYQLDLGQAWEQLTGLPFVFAIWMTKQGTELGDLPQKLLHLQQANASKRALIASQHAKAHGWPVDLACTYLCDRLHYTIGDNELKAIETFGRYAFELGLIQAYREIQLVS